MVGWTFTRTLTPVLMKLNSSPGLRLYNEKSDIIRPYYNLTHLQPCIASFASWTSWRALRPTTIAKIRLRTDCCNGFSQFFKYGSKSSTDTKVPWSKSSWTFWSTGANVSGNESSAGTKVPSVPSVDFLFPGTKVQRNEKSKYPFDQ